MKKTLSRALALVLTLTLLLPCMVFFATPASAAEYRVAYGNGPSASYKSSKYYQHFLKIPLSGDGRTDTLALALSQMGYHEGGSTSDMAGNSSVAGNYTEYNWNAGNAWTGGYSYEWCACFCSWALYQAKQTNHGTSYKDLCRYHKNDPAYIWREVGCGHWVNNLKAAGIWKYSKYYGGTYAPQPGDLVFFRNAAHIGMVVYSDSSYVYTIEGNTSDAQGLEPSGGGVYFKSYAIGSSLLDGYGVLPYKTNASVPKVDYSGKNPTAGLWMTNAIKYIYSDAACTVDTGKRIPRFTLIEVTAVAPSRKALKVTYNGTTGYVALNNDRVIQLTSTTSVDPELQASRDKLQALVDTVSGISYKNYTDDRLTTLRAKYNEAQAVLVNEDATKAQYDNAYTALNTAYNNKNTNNVRGVYISGVNTRVTNGQAVLFTSKFGTITTENASHTWTANIRAKWNDQINGYLALGVTAGTGPDTTPSVTLADDEILIAVHNWEKEGDTNIPASENPVVGSYENYINSWIPEYGGYKINFNGVNIQNGILDVGAYISFEKVDATPGSSVGTNIAFKKKYTTTGLYAENGSVLWPDEEGTSLTNGLVTNKVAAYDNPEFAGFNANSEDFIRDGYASITVDLGQNFEINKFIAHIASKYNLAEAGVFAPQTLELFVSNDKSYWHKAGTVNIIDDIEVATILAQLELSEPVYGRYIQYRLSGTTSWIMVSEVEAYGTASSNIVDYKPVTPPVVDPSDDPSDEPSDDPSDDPSTPEPPIDEPVNPEPPIDEPTFVKGDINESGDIDSMDYVLLKRAYFGTYTLSDIAVGDIDEDNTIGAMDYVYLRRAYFGTYVIK